MIECSPKTKMRDSDKKDNKKITQCCVDPFKRKNYMRHVK